MKKNLLWCFLLFVLKSVAQPITNLQHFDENRLQWGYYFGLNTFDFKPHYKDFNYLDEKAYNIKVERTEGFQVGLSGTLYLMKYLALRTEPGLITNKRMLYFPGFQKVKDSKRAVNSTYIYMPLMLKYSAERWYNFKPYLTLGASAAINLSSNQNINKDNSEQRFRSTKMVYFYELGVGLDFYTPYFRFSPSIRGLFSVGDELVRDYDPHSKWTTNFTGLFSRGILFSLLFE